MDEGVLRKIVECAKSYRDLYRMRGRNQDDINRARMVLFLALDELEGERSANTRVEPGRSIEEGAGVGAPVDVASC